MQSATVLPLHGGRAPRWLFGRMVRLCGAISSAMVDEYGAKGFVQKLADPYWLQALACAVGYDWHSSGTTTVTMGALKEALNYNSDIFIAGGKGRQGLLTPEQIESGTDYLSIGARAEQFKHLSKITAKADYALVYDNIGIYHHTFVFSKQGDWAVVQQGMIEKSANAIRFQIDGSTLNNDDVINEINNAVSAQNISETMDLTSAQNGDVRQLSAQLVREDISQLLHFDAKAYALPARHNILYEDLSDRARSLLRYANELQPQNYEKLLQIKGIGRKTMRSLAIIASLIYDKQIYRRDPVMYAYNIGGKDGIPFPVDRRTYDKVTDAMQSILDSARLDKREQIAALKRVAAGAAEAYNTNAAMQVRL